MKQLPGIRHLLLSASILSISACGPVLGISASDDPNVAAAQAATKGEGKAGMMAMADDLMAQGKYTAAIPLYRHLSRGLGGNSEARIKLAGALIAQGEHQEAGQILLAQVKGDNPDPEAQYLLGRSMLALGRFEEARDAFSAAAGRTADSGATYSGLGIAQAATGNVGAAIDAFDTAGTGNARSNKGLVLAATGNASDAVDVLESLIEEGNAGARDRQNLAFAYLMDGRDHDAYRMARLDLDMVSVEETFTFYRSLMDLDPTYRMQALVTGAVNPAWTDQEQANLELTDTPTRRAAAERLLEPEAEPLPEPEPAPEPEPEPIDLDSVPPLLEAEGYALQIAAYRTIENLMKGMQILYGQNMDLLSEIPPRRSEVDHGEREEGPSGFYYRLNVGPLRNYQQAKDLCDQLLERGTACWVRPPEVSEGRLPEDQQ